jgi:hypothetical protein
MQPRSILPAALAAALLAATAAFAQSGGAYNLEWNTLTGGGQSSATGGAYVHSGTAGQPDAGSLAGGAYALAGGFWAGAQPYTTGVEGGGDPVPKVFAARLGGPNPFHTSTSIQFELPASARVNLVVYGVDGRAVARVLDAERGAGRHTVFWNGEGRDGRQVAAGIYFARLTAGHAHATLRIARVR